MGDSPRMMNSSLEEWLEQNFPSCYTSCIKINGRPILPPMMSEERRIEMRRFRDMAIDVENKIIKKRESAVQVECAGGEALYEGAGEDIHFANSLPTSLADNAEKSVLGATFATSNDQAHSIQTACDMLQEFDPLADREGCGSAVPQSFNLLEYNLSDDAEIIARNSECTVSKPGSADSSVALSYSTDLNNYMDITESSVDISVPCSDVKSAAGTDVTTPSTIRPDSTGSQTNYGGPLREGKTTYEDLSNYLDSLLNNNSESKKQRPPTDNNQNVVNWQTMATNLLQEDSKNVVLPSSFPQVSKSLESNLLPLTSPPGGLQTRLVVDVDQQKTPTKTDPTNSDGCSNFLQDCALSPVKSDLQNSYEQNVNLYLQNLILDHTNASEQSENESVSKQPRRFDGVCKEFFTKLDDLTSRTNGTSSQIGSAGNLNGYLEAPPRLVRSNSYTLESPSPMLLAHMEAELKKNVRNEGRQEEQARSSQNNGAPRRVWDVEKAKNMPSWCTRQSNLANNHPKYQSPRKVPNRNISAVLSPSKNSEHSDTSGSKAVKSKIGIKYTDQTRPRKSGVSSQQEMSGNVQESSLQALNYVSSDKEDPRAEVRSLLLKLQLQHNEEMEALLNRQRQEKEAIRLALLREQTVNSWKTAQVLPEVLLPHTSLASNIKSSSQSPPTKEKALMERRNTSPSIYEKGNNDELHTCLLKYNKSSSISLEDVSGSVDKCSLIDLECEDKSSNIKNNCAGIKGSSMEQKGGMLTSTSFLDNLLGSNNIPPPISSEQTDFSSLMIASFPPSEIPFDSQLESMTSSLPPKILSSQLSNAELTSENFKPSQMSSMSSSNTLPISACVASVAQSQFSTATVSSTLGGSPRSKRRSWCHRQLFPDDFEWVSQSQEIQKHFAAMKIQAGARGYLTRRLLKTERVQNCITTIRDTIVCALQLQQECAPHVEPSDLQLHGRLIQQLSAACEELHNIFMGIPVEKRMAIIASDRERIRMRTPRSQSSSGSRPLSRATQIALQRKLNMTEPPTSLGLHSRSSSANRSRRRSWATVETRTRQPLMPTGAANNCNVVAGCLSRSSAPISHPLQRSASAGSGRKPWR